MTTISIMALLYVVAYIVFGLWDRMQSTEVEDYEEQWVCEFCGTEIHSATIEGLVEGFRIHQTAIYCPGDDDDDEQHYA